MTKKQGTFGIVFLIPILLLVIGGIVFWGIKQSQPAKQSTTSTPQASPITIVSSSPRDNGLKTFKSSDVMDFTIDVPVDYMIGEKLGRVTLNTLSGKIFIDRNGTNFDSLENYLDDLDKRNNPKILEEERIMINNYQSVVRLVKFGTGEIQKSIIIYSNNWIYNFYTDVTSLYPDLDQIAKSFRYTP